MQLKRDSKLHTYGFEFVLRVGLAAKEAFLGVSTYLVNQVRRAQCGMHDLVCSRPPMALLAGCFADAARVASALVLVGAHDGYVLRRYAFSVWRANWTYGYADALARVCIPRMRRALA